MSRHTYRGKRVDGQGWAEGDLIHGVGCKDGRIFILPEYSVQSTLSTEYTATGVLYSVQYKVNGSSSEISESDF